ncbi:helix-turn-helix domain-containing protein [Brachybacterium sp. DNPG3]
MPADTDRDHRPDAPREPRDPRTDTPREELGRFLRARRAELTPRAAGLPEGTGTRRVVGLRREEVAQLASISTDYYTRIEQGRIRVSAPVLATLADVLRLDEDQRLYLVSLTGETAVGPPRSASQEVRPQLRRLLDDLGTTPAIVMGRRMDVLAWNRLAAAMIVDFARFPAAQRNYVRILFTVPAMRSLYEDWESVARTAVAQLRMEAAKEADDARLAALVAELTARDAQFAHWWEARGVASLSTGTKTLVHPRVGRLVLDWDTLAEASDADQQLVVWTADPNSPTGAALRMLAADAAAGPGSGAPTGGSSRR